jgi:hypothetical protein
MRAVLGMTAFVLMGASAFALPVDDGHVPAPPSWSFECSNIWEPFIDHGNKAVRYEARCSIFLPAHVASHENKEGPPDPASSKNRICKDERESGCSPPAVEGEGVPDRESGAGREPREERYSRFGGKESIPPAPNPTIPPAREPSKGSENENGAISQEPISSRGLSFGCGNISGPLVDDSVAIVQYSADCHVIMPCEPTQPSQQPPNHSAN